MGESILEEPANSNVVECSYNSKIRLTAMTVCREIALGRQGLTEDAMPLQRASLGQIGYDVHTVSSLPAIIAAEIWIAAIRIH